MNAHPKVKVMSTGCLGVKANWFTAPHVEWGGVTCCLNIWLQTLFFVDNARAEDFFAIQSLQGLNDLLIVNPKSRKKQKNGFYLTEHSYYHIGETG